MLLQMIGIRIKQVRKKKGLTQEELAEKAGINASYMGTVERGERNISIETLEKIIRGLDMTPSDFFQFHEINIENLTNDNHYILEVVKSLLHNRSLEENKLILRVIQDILATLDSGNK